MIEGKGLGGKRINRVNLSLDNKTNNKLSKLAIACNMPKTTLARMILEIGLSNADVVNELQEKFNTNQKYRIYPIKINDKIEY